MKKKQIKEWMLVTCFGLGSLIVSFMVYYLFFLLLEQIFVQVKTYAFVQPLRVGYGFLWMIIGVTALKFLHYEYMKAGLITGSIGTSMIVLGVFLYQVPVLFYIIFALVCFIFLFLLFKYRKSWYYYYALALAILAILFYI